MQSNDPVRQVVAFLHVGDNIYVGYNHIPGITEGSELWKNREAIRVLATHAEVDAVRAALADGVTEFDDAILYVSLHPCEQCMRMIRAIGISQVYYNEEYVPSGGVTHVDTKSVTVSKLPE